METVEENAHRCKATGVITRMFYPSSFILVPNSEIKRIAIYRSQGSDAFSGRYETFAFIIWIYQTGKYKQIKGLDKFPTTVFDKKR